MEFKNKLEEKYFQNRMEIGEIARYNMIEFCNFYKDNNVMSKDEFFELQKKALKKFREEQEGEE